MISHKTIEEKRKRGELLRLRLGWATAYIAVVRLQGNMHTKMASNMISLYNRDFAIFPMTSQAQVTS
jgi:hypothetical protein